MYATVLPQKAVGGVLYLYFGYEMWKLAKIAEDDDGFKQM